MDNDDRMVGRVLSRREAMRLVAAGGVATIGAWSATVFGGGVRQAPATMPGCVVRPEIEEGPFFVDHQLNRSDLRSDPATGTISAGLPLALAFIITQADNRCAPLAGAMVDVWQCDARGVYSGVSGPGQPSQASRGKALRGFQVTDAHGLARFTTIFPGWYQGRTAHIHFKVRTTTAPAGAYEFTSQLFFDEALITRVYANPPYAGRGRRDTTNDADGIFRNGGQKMLLSPSEDHDGLAATFALGIDLSDAATGRPDGNGGRGRGRGRGSSLT